MKSISFPGLVLLSTIILCPQDSIPETIPTIAVLEETQHLQSQRIVIRALFSKTDTGWVALTDRDRFDSARLSPGMRWSVTYGDRQLGEMAVADQFPSLGNVWYFPRDMMLELASDQDTILVDNLAGQFSGWSKTPEYRPLVLVNTEHYTDPEGWEAISITPTSSLRQLLFPAFPFDADSISLGVDYYGNHKGYREIDFDDLVIIGGYRNQSGNVIVGTRINPNLGQDSYGLFQNPQWTVHWFHVLAKPVYIGSWLEFVDAGDFDGDGSSEIVFWYSAYNRDGYSLFSDNFSKRTDFWWSYH